MHKYYEGLNKLHLSSLVLPLASCNRSGADRALKYQRLEATCLYVCVLVL